MAETLCNGFWKITFSKATLLSSFTHSSVRNPATSNLRDESKHFITSHPKYILKESLMAEEDRAGVREFLYGKYKSGKINLNEALYIFDCIICMQPTPPLSSFNILFTALVKNKDYDDILSLQKRLISVGSAPDFITSNILITHFCNTEYRW
ncbi:hypothetical protein ACOSQ2_021241 [Xanthoceras sorbifolium]